ncbi:MAG: hypothetical protein Q8R15_03870 [Candidatus Micrarchaeota archaeon]|nr:hypothetical protein [Candidatus Micrarchaeota archaeon]
MGLLDFLKREEKASRLIFGKRELQIIRKQLMGESLKQSERNRLSKFIRPKLRFMADCGKYSEEFELKRKATLKTLIKDTKKAILKDKLGRKAIAILLYAPKIEQSSGATSIHLCAMFKEIKTREAEKFRMRITKRVPEIVSVQVFNTLPIWIRLEIARNYKIVYESKEFDEDFWIYTIKEASESRAMKIYLEKKKELLKTTN